ncbi:hypothetical protein Pcinc_044123, partial [Petrolisthes cinctipes]
MRRDKLIGLLSGMSAECLCCGCGEYGGPVVREYYEGGCCVTDILGGLSLVSGISQGRVRLFRREEQERREGGSEREEEREAGKREEERRRRKGRKGGKQEEKGKVGGKIRKGREKKRRKKGG